MIYLDIEANNQEIISIGAIDSNGREFYSLARPMSKLSPAVVKITNLKENELRAAPHVETTLRLFREWLQWSPQILVFGHNDKNFIKNSLKYVGDLSLTLFFSSLVLYDQEQYVTKSLHKKHVSLNESYKILKGPKLAGPHNALNDAKKLKFILETIHLRQDKK